MISAKLIVEPDVNGNTRIVAVMVRTTRVIPVNIFKYFNAGNVLLV